MLNTNDTVVQADGSELVVTAIRNGGVYVVSAKTIDASGAAAGAERFLGSVEEVENGEKGTVYAAQ